MKKINLFYGLIILSMQVSLAQQTYTDKIAKEFTLKKKDGEYAIVVSNINGYVRVVGYDGDKVVVEVERTITAKTADLLEKGKRDIKLGYVDQTDSLIFYVDGTCNEFGKMKNGEGWGYEWNNCKNLDCNKGFNYKMNFDVKVPATNHVTIHTINDGDLEVENVIGKVKAHNVNGGIRLTNLVQAATASTINGNLDVEYARNPEEECRFYSLNGDINANFQKELASQMNFKSFNGNLYTNISQIEALPSTLEKNDKGQGVQYKIKGNAFKLGKGGALLDFETFNGNVYLKEKTN